MGLVRVHFKSGTDLVFFKCGGIVTVAYGSPLFLPQRVFCAVILVLHQYALCHYIYSSFPPFRDRRIPAPLVFVHFLPVHPLDESLVFHLEN